MTRKKITLAFISNESARKVTFRKRKKGFLKKMYELTTLCEIEACAIIYSPYDAQPEAWPSADGAQRVLSKFRRMPEIEKCKKMTNQEALLHQRINKATEQYMKMQKENREKEITQVMQQCLSGMTTLNISLVDLNDLGWLIDQNLKQIYKRIEALKKQAAAPTKPARQAAAVNPAPPPPPPQPVDPLRIHCDGDLQQFQREVFESNTNQLVAHQEAMSVTRGSWFMDLMGPHDPSIGGFGGAATEREGGGLAADNMPMTFTDYTTQNLNSLWPSAFFP